MIDKKRYKTVVVSDIHLGSKWSHVKEVIEFLNSVECDLLILNGDIIDGWHLGRNRKKWKYAYNSFMTLILDIKKRGTKIIYIRGNHDDFLDNVIPFCYDDFEVLENYIYESFGKKYYVFHGDLFDNVTSNIRWMSKVGDRLYSLLLQVNRYYNDHRRRIGKKYFSISKAMKDRVKRFVSKHSKFDDNIEAIAHKHNCQGVIVGHIHQAEIRQINGINYLNSGDWIESLTALCEDDDGNWTIYKNSQVHD